MPSGFADIRGVCYARKPRPMWDAGEEDLDRGGRLDELLMVVVVVDVLRPLLQCLSVTGDIHLVRPD